MKTIWKYELGVQGESEISMPRNPHILYAGEQFGKLCVWALVDSDAPTDVYRFRIFGTGNQVTMTTPLWRFIDTVLMGGGRLVLHVFVKVDENVTH